MDLSARLDQAMRHAGYPSQAALARAAGLPQSTVNRILKGPGKQGPDTVTVSKLADACGVSADWLIFGTAPTPDESVAELFLVYLDQEEMRLVTQYREANLAGRMLIKSIADNACRDSSPPPANDH